MSAHFVEKTLKMIEDELFEISSTLHSEYLVRNEKVVDDIQSIISEYIDLKYFGISKQIEFAVAMKIISYDFANYLRSTVSKKLAAIQEERLTKFDW
ncbi:hypothetical protein A5867_000879 [Enterococcus sp. 6D12_DIV0197]|uniref:DUF1507 family protein n=1 Tax=Enterococcus sp. 6D12_DIV0197 TaxID=1834184 RepID=UPI000B3E67F6|nr:DUF1507 family protein [Enterococcus sp. 6D12_DIV0197]OUZ23196.1 hypothetical protein A5867_000879 [Enterococcus sp. 6D12_DIV0197]